MAQFPGYMAQLNRELLTFSAAATGITLMIGKRLSRNFSSYRKRADQVEKVYRDDMLMRIDEAIELSYTLHNLMIEEENRNAPFMVAIAGQIADLLDEIHHNLLLYNADDILDIIPPLDALREVWSGYTESEFYGHQLSHHIEHQFPQNISKIEMGVHNLPYIATL